MQALGTHCTWLAGLLCQMQDCNSESHSSSQGLPGSLKPLSDCLQAFTVHAEFPALEWGEPLVQPCEHPEQLHLNHPPLVLSQRLSFQGKD
jgi:hypothetical protein